MTQRTKPTPEVIEVEIERLKAVYPLVPTHSFFGDDNRSAITAQIRVLQERMSLDQLHEAFGEQSDAGEFSQNTLDCALTAHDWMEGLLAEDESPPEIGWEGIAR